MTKKARQFSVTPWVALPPRVTPTLVTPLVTR